MRATRVGPTGFVTMAAILLAGCATKNFGNLPPLTQHERQILTCREIQLEQAKVQGFWEHVAKENQTGGRDLLAFLGDFGIGNQMALRSAQESANQRTDQLLAAAEEKGCFAGSATTQSAGTR